MKRLTRLDGLRGVLAVYVMLGHALPFTDLPAWLCAVFAHGEAAVDLFFALSGLVIVGSVEHFEGRFWPFMYARARRLLPVYYVVLAAAVLVLVLGPPALPWVAGRGLARDVLGGGMPPDLGWHLAAHVTLSQGLLPRGVLPFAYVTLLGPAWSLSTEWQFYVLIALLLPRLPGTAPLATLALGVLALGVAYHAVAPALPAWWQFSRAFLPDAAPYFALGMASAVLLRGSGAKIFWISLALCCALGWWSATPGRVLIPLFWALALLVQSRPGFPVLGAMLDSRTAQYLGAISYPLYLLNEPVQRLAMLCLAKAAHGEIRLFTILWLPAAIAFTLGLSALLHETLEKSGERKPFFFVKKKCLLP